MIASLAGILRDQRGEMLIVDVHGVGYEVLATRSVLSRAGSLGQKIELVVYTDVKENAISLFGFNDFLERQVFLMLRKVKGVGSRTALTVISAIGAERLLIAIGQGDVTALQQVSGIGKKTAERLIVELREHVKALVTPDEMPLTRQVEKICLGSGSITGVLHLEPVAEDVILALEKLGFSLERARKAVISAMEILSKEGTVHNKDAGELLKLALAHI